MIKLTFEVNDKEFEKETEMFKETAEIWAASVINKVSDSTYNEIHKRINDDPLHTLSHKDIYTNNLKRSFESPFDHSVSLEQEAWFLEEGWSSFDLRDSILEGGSQGVKYSKKDQKPYMIVPIKKHKNPSGTSPSRELSLSEVQAKSMIPTFSGVSKDLTQLLAETKQSSSGYMGKSKYRNLRATQNTLAGMITEGPRGFGKYEDVYKKYSGISRYRSAGSNGSEFVAFRTMSYDSAASWKHPGYKGYQIFPEMEVYAQVMLQDILSKGAF